MSGTQARGRQLAREVELERIYNDHLKRPGGLEVQRGHPARRRLDDTIKVREEELVNDAIAYHPVVAAHGYNMYYLNALGAASVAGRGRSPGSPATKP